MKLQSINLWWAITLVITICFTNCEGQDKISKTTISVANLKKATLDTSSALTLLEILKTYPAKMECTRNEKYANLYVCRKFSNGDTVYVFEECLKVNKIALDTSSHFAAVIDQNNVMMSLTNEFLIFVPAGFKIPEGAKYINAKLDYQTEY